MDQTDVVNERESMCNPEDDFMPLQASNIPITLRSLNKIIQTFIRCIFHNNHCLVTVDIVSMEGNDIQAAFQHRHRRNFFPEHVTQARLLRYQYRLDDN